MTKCSFLTAAIGVFGIVLPLAVSAEGLPSNIRTIFDVNCQKCHNPASTNKKAVKELPDIFDLDDMVRRKQIIPGQPEKSKVYTQVETDVMPDGAEYMVEFPVPDEDKAILKAWIVAMTR